MRSRPSISALVVVLAALAPTFAQTPDCTGISGVVNSDPDLVGELDKVLVANGFTRPLSVTFAPGDDERMFVYEKAGLIKLVKDGVVQPTPFLDIDSIVLGGASNEDERGLLGMAFHPDYQNNGFFYVYYTATSPSGAVTLARYERMTADQADAGSGTILLSISHPIGNHNGGMLAFSPADGHLYMAIGDGGSGCDPGAFPGNAQNRDVLLGKLLRLDVDGAFPYGTEGNPFDGPVSGADEIWHFGLRNPFRFSFDRVTGDLYIGDVGQNSREELDCAPDGVGGLNFGWNAYEGFLCDTCNEWAPPCPIDLGEEYREPYRDYSLAGTPCSVIGGYVYRGCRMPDLRGSYFYADHCGLTSTVGLMNTLRTDVGCQTAPGPDLNRWLDLELGESVLDFNTSGFGEDNRGELYLVDHDDGEIYKLIPEMFIMEVSGPGATPFAMNADGDFGWEDLPATSDVPTRFYKVYRADMSVPGVGPGPFTCIHSQLSGSSTWTGGDLDTPTGGQVFYYLVTAQNADLEESTAGRASDGTVRVVDTGSLCN